MSHDTTLRGAARRAAATGAPADRAALLSLRLRSAPACERCGGSGSVEAVAVPVLTPRGPLVSMDTAPVLPCSSCAGTGSPLRARIELAAYLGNEAAQGATGMTVNPPVIAALGIHVDEMQAFVLGLFRWSDVGPVPGWVLVRAAVAAARVALSRARRGVSGPGGQSMEACAAREEAHATVRAAHRAITAAEVWLDDPTDDARWTAWHVSYVEAGHLAWLPVPTRASETGARAQDAILSATFAGEQPVREAICKALVAFALEDA